MDADTITLRIDKVIEVVISYIYLEGCSDDKLDIFLQKSKMVSFMLLADFSGGMVIGLDGDVDGITLGIDNI